MWYQVLLALTGTVSLSLAAYAWPRRRERAVGPFVVAAGVGALWPLLVLLEMLIPGVELKSVVARLRPPLILTAASALLMMAMRHGGWVGPRWFCLAVLAPAPVMTLVANFVPVEPGWFQRNFRPHPQIPELLAYEGGWWGELYEVYTPLLGFAVVLVLLMQARQYQGMYRRRVLLMAFGVAAPTMIYLAQLGGLLQWTVYNLPPLGMGVTVLCGAWVLLRDQYLELVPVARAAILEQWPDPVLVVNPRGEVLDLNPAAARVMGVSLGAAVRELDGPWREVLAGIEGRTAEQGQIAAGDKTWSYEVQPLAGGREEWQGWALVARDVTETERASAALVTLNESLQSEIRQRRETEARLLEAHRIETIGRLSGGLAHEFNNLTMVINGYATLLLSRLPEGDESRRELEAIAQAGEDAARLTAQLLAFSRQQVMRADRIDMRMLVREAEHMWATLLGERIRLRVEAGQSPCWVQADAPKVRDALTQLILNARDATREGGVVTVLVERVWVSRGTLPRTPDFGPGDCINVSVADTGMGMDAATLSRAMEPFFSTKGVGQGSGLGLSSAYGIARQCGGALEIDSVPGAGTSARLYLPAVGPPARTEIAETAGKARILVVEDQAEVRRLLRDVLEADGHEVVEAGGAAAALRVLESPEGRPRVLVTDLVMPGLSGQELIRRAVEMAPSLRVLVISGYSEQECERADGFLRKPFPPDEFCREVRRLLQLRPPPDGANGDTL